MNTSKFTLISYKGIKSFPASRGKMFVFGLLLIVSFVSTLVIPFAFGSRALASGTTLTATGGNQVVGTAFDATVSISTGGASICAIKLDLQFPPELLEVTGLNHGNTYTVEAVKNYSNQDGRIHYTAGATGCSTADDYVLIIHFNPIKAGSGEIKFLSKNVVTADSSGEPFSIEATVQNASFNNIGNTTPPTSTTDPQSDSGTYNTGVIPHPDNNTPNYTPTNTPKKPAKKPSTTTPTPITTTNVIIVRTPNLTNIEFNANAVLEKANKRSKGVKFTGSADPNAQVYTYIDNEPLPAVSTNALGVWEMNYNDWLKDGQHTFVAKAAKSGQYSKELMTSFSISSSGKDQIAIGAKLPGTGEIRRGNEIIYYLENNVYVLAGLLILWFIIIVGIVIILAKKIKDKYPRIKNIE